MEIPVGRDCCLYGFKHRRRLLEDLLEHVVFESHCHCHQSNSGAAVAFFSSHNHKAAEPAIPASAPYFAGKIGISLARVLMLHFGRFSRMPSNHSGMRDPTPPPITITSGSRRSTMLPNQI